MKQSDVKISKGKIQVSLTAEEWSSLKMATDKQRSPDWKQKDIEDALLSQSAMLKIIYGSKPKQIREPIILDLPVYFGQKKSDVHEYIHNGLDNPSREHFDTTPNFQIIDSAITHFINTDVVYNFPFSRKFGQAAWVGGTNTGCEETTNYEFCFRGCKIVPPSRVRQKSTTITLPNAPIDIQFSLAINDNGQQHISDIERLEIVKNYHFMLSGDIHFDENNHLQSIDIRKLSLMNLMDNRPPVVIIKDPRDDDNALKLAEMKKLIELSQTPITRSWLPFDEEPPF